MNYRSRKVCINGQISNENVDFIPCIKRLNKVYDKPVFGQLKSGFCTAILDTFFSIAIGYVKVTVFTNMFLFK
jgi:hypothetical protein